MKINTTELIKEMSVLKNYLAKNDIRPLLKEINATFKDNSLTLEATNSYIAYRTTLDVERESFDTDFQNVTFDYIDFKDFKKSTIISLNFKDRIATNNTDNKTISININELGDYPSLDNILHVFTKHKFALKASVLKDMLKGLEKDDIVVFKYDSLKQYAPLGFEVNGKENKKGVIGQCRQ